MINIPKFPVVIIASPRTGSGALSNHLRNIYAPITEFNEPDKNNKMEEFLKFYQSEMHWILKILVSSVDQYPDMILSNKCFKIKNLRKNVVDQIASHYVATKRSKWIYFSDTVSNETYNDLIDIDLDAIDTSIKWIQYDNKCLELIKTDITVYYEDIEKYQSFTEPTPKPQNYNEVIETIKQRINNV
jgi:hypothetical protein